MMTVGIPTVKTSPRYYKCALLLMTSNTTWYYIPALMPEHSRYRISTPSRIVNGRDCIIAEGRIQVNEDTIKPLKFSTWGKDAFDIMMLQWGISPYQLTDYTGLY